MSSETVTCPTGFISRRPAVRSIAVVKAILRSTFNTPSRQRLTTIWWQMFVSGRRLWLVAQLLQFDRHRSMVSQPWKLMKKNASVVVLAIHRAHPCRLTILSIQNSPYGWVGITLMHAASRASRSLSPQEFQIIRPAGRKRRPSSRKFSIPTRMMPGIGSE